jgi:hypothetical protein
MIGIPFLWGGNNPEAGLDCFGLADYARAIYLLSPLPNHDWVYREFTYDTFPPELMVELCRDSLREVRRSPELFDIVCLRGESISLGTCLNNQVLHFSPQGLSSFTPLSVLQRKRLIVGVFDAFSI